MLLKATILLLSLTAAAQAGLLGLPAVKVLQGPGSKTTLLGPDGSALESRAPGGTVAIDGSPLAAVGPALLAAGPEIAVRGPAGAVLTSYTAAGPALVPALGAPAGVVVGPGLQAAWAGGDGDDHAGDYVPDHAEQQYDDGSYKGDY